MSDLIKVDGHPHLARNKHTGAIVNINSKSINDARAAKARRQSDKQRLDEIESKVESILTILQELVNKDG